MKILGIDSTSNVCSVAIVDETKTLAEFNLNLNKTHSETLMPMIETIFSMMNFSMEQIDAIACCNGPGSFTGLRIGAASAKGLAFARGLSLIPVSTLKALAYNIVSCENALIVPLIDARRDEAYTAFYYSKNNLLYNVQNDCALHINDIIEKIKFIFNNETEDNSNYLVENKSKRVIFLGDITETFKDKILSSNLKYSFAPNNNNLARAASVASLGLEMYKENKTYSLADFKLEYLRLSQAERELGVKNEHK